MIEALEPLYIDTSGTVYLDQGQITNVGQLVAGSIGRSFGTSCFTMDLMHFLGLKDQALCFCDDDLLDLCPACILPSNALCSNIPAMMPIVINRAASYNPAPVRYPACTAAILFLYCLPVHLCMILSAVHCRTSRLRPPSMCQPLLSSVYCCNCNRNVPVCLCTGI